MSLRLTFVAATALLAAPLAAQQTGTMTGERGTITGRVDVEDGDDLWLGPVRVRLRGIDAPKKSERCNG